jgi:hypothetical protein
MAYEQGPKRPGDKWLPRCLARRCDRYRNCRALSEMRLQLTSVHQAPSGPERARSASVRTFRVGHIYSRARTAASRAFGIRIPVVRTGRDRTASVRIRYAASLSMRVVRIGSFTTGPWLRVSPWSGARSRSVAARCGWTRLACDPRPTVLLRDKKMRYAVVRALTTRTFGTA